jgi:hypothetical protein
MKIYFNKRGLILILVILVLMASNRSQGENLAVTSLWEDVMNKDAIINYEVVINQKYSGIYSYSFYDILIETSVITFKLTGTMDFESLSQDILVNGLDGKKTDGTESLLFKDVSNFDTGSSTTLNLVDHGEKRYRIVETSLIEVLNETEDGDYVNNVINSWKLELDDLTDNIVTTNTLIMSKVSGTMLYQNLTINYSNGTLISQKIFRALNYQGFQLTEESFNFTITPTETKKKAESSPGFTLLPVLTGMAMVLIYIRKYR